MAKNRYIGDYPVIGIRPCIDGRRGPLKVRESLEDQTMGMAKAVQKLYEENLRYSNGEPVKVIIADTTIGRVAEAAACEAKFRKEGVAITLSPDNQGCMGTERNRETRSCLSGICTRYLFTERTSGIRYLRQGCSGGRRRYDPR